METGREIAVSQTAEYRAWHYMRSRVKAPAKVRWYGHVRICTRWQKFSAFLADMGRKPTPAHSLDRKDGRKGYSPDNCRWATRVEQARNQPQRRYLTINARRQQISEWAEESGNKIPTICQRLRDGWEPERAVFERSRSEIEQTNCRKGHPLDGVFQFPDGRIIRFCKECKRQYNNARYHRLKK